MVALSYGSYEVWQGCPDKTGMRRDTKRLDLIRRGTMGRGLIRYGKNRSDAGPVLYDPL